MLSCVRATQEFEIFCNVVFFLALVQKKPRTSPIDTNANVGKSDFDINFWNNFINGVITTFNIYMLSYLIVFIQVWCTVLSSSFRSKYFEVPLLEVKTTMRWKTLTETINCNHINHRIKLSLMIVAANYLSSSVPAKLTSLSLTISLVILNILRQIKRIPR